VIRETVFRTSLRTLTADARETNRFTNTVSWYDDVVSITCRERQFIISGVEGVFVVVVLDKVEKKREKRRVIATSRSFPPH